MPLSIAPKPVVSVKNPTPSSSSSDGIEYHEVYAGSSYSTAQKLGFSLEKGAKAGLSAAKSLAKKVSNWLGLPELAHEIEIVLQVVGGLGIFIVGCLLVWAFAHPQSAASAALLLV